MPQRIEEHSESAEVEPGAVLAHQAPGLQTRAASDEPAPLGDGGGPHVIGIVRALGAPRVARRDEEHDEPHAHEMRRFSKPLHRPRAILPWFRCGGKPMDGFWLSRGSSIFRMPRGRSAAQLRA
jgi:hypothetical protein